MFIQNYGVGISVNCAKTAYEKEEKMKRQQEQAVNEYIKANIKSTQPMVEELKALEEYVNALEKDNKERNRILQTQVDEAKKDGEEAKKVSKRANIISLVSIGITIAFFIWEHIFQ